MRSTSAFCLRFAHSSSGCLSVSALSISLPPSPVIPPPPTPKQRALDEMDDVVSCPRLVCQKPVIVENDSTLGHCRACEFRFCVLCQRAWHGVNECSAGAPIGDGSIDVIELYIKADDDEKKRLERKYGARRLQQSAAERLSHEYLSEVSQACPKCGLHIHKTDGCNKVRGWERACVLLFPLV